MKHIVIADAATIRKLPGIPATSRLAGMALLSAKTGKVSFTLPDNRQIIFDKRDGGPEAEIDIHDYAFAKRSIAGGDVGFAESYIDQQWSTPDLTAVLRYFGDNFDAVGNGDLARGKKTVRFMNMIRHFLNRNSKSGSKIPYFGALGIHYQTRCS